MSKGPKGPKRPADVISNAVHVMRIATGEINEITTQDGKSEAAVELGRKAGLPRAQTLSRKRRIEIARQGATAKHAASRNPANAMEDR